MEFFVRDRMVWAESEFPRTRKNAIKASIDKWNFIVEYIKDNHFAPHDGSSLSCPLCNLYVNNICEGCPVFKKTGKTACESTPYHQYDNARIEHQSLSTCLRYARAEVKFLQSLLKETK